MNTDMLIQGDRHFLALSLCCPQTNGQGELPRTLHKGVEQGSENRHPGWEMKNTELNVIIQQSIGGARVSLKLQNQSRGIKSLRYVWTCIVINIKPSCH